jgi:hypothetical protein
MSPDSYEPSDPTTPQPPTPSAGGGGGGVSQTAEHPEPYHAESARLLTVAGAKRPSAIRSASRLPPERVQAILADDREGGRGVGSSVQRCIAEADAPDLSALIAAGGTPCATEPPPSDAPIWDLPPHERQTWLARFRRAETPAEQREVLARLQRECPREETYGRPIGAD